MPSFTFIIKKMKTIAETTKNKLKINSFNQETKQENSGN